jgi:very-short-patch-repair endonuclease
MEPRPSPGSLRSPPSPARARGAGTAEGAAQSSPLPRAGEGGAKRRVRVVGKSTGATGRSRALRRASTPEEQTLWRYLRNRNLDGWKFSRQYPVGPYFADFICREAWLIVEIDGGQHSESLRDIARDRFLRRAGYGVLRFWNNEVTDNLEGVLTVLRLVLEGRPSPGLRYAPATLSRVAGEGKKE